VAPSGGLVGPAGDAFYTPPAGAPGKPGTLIWARDFTAPAGLKGRTILYWSTSATGALVAVSGTVITPTAATATTDRKVMAWAHGTVGLGDTCAPSRHFADGTAPELAFAPLLTQTDAVFVATDYEGLGTAGDPAYLVGRSEGHGVLDAARALQQLSVGVTAASPVLLWGHSQGGGAAAWAAELAPTYAPDLKVVGAMVGAPAGELSLEALTAAVSGNVISDGVAALVGFKAAYPDLALDPFLTPKGLDVVAKLRSNCGEDATVAGLTPADLVLPTLAAAPGWAQRIAENNPAGQATSVPIFMYHGDADTTVPASVSATMLAKYCKLGVMVSRKVYPGKGHVDVIPAALTDLVTYATARWAGTKPTDSCA
jgi:pimeloyl-ACP methyl ester carboxylesterase